MNRHAILLLSSLVAVVSFQTAAMGQGDVTVLSLDLVPSPATNVQSVTANFTLANLHAQGASGPFQWQILVDGAAVTTKTTSSLDRRSGRGPVVHSWRPLSRRPQN